MCCIDKGKSEEELRSAAIEGRGWKGSEEEGKYSVMRGAMSCTYVHCPKTQSAVKRAGSLCGCKPEMECNPRRSAILAKAPETSRPLFTNRVRLNSFAGPDLLTSVF